MPWTEKCKLISKDPGTCSRYFINRVHGLLWIKNAPHYEKNDATEIIEYIDSIISCSFIENEKKYTDLQLH